MGGENRPTLGVYGGGDPAAEGGFHPLARATVFATAAALSLVISSMPLAAPMVWPQAQNFSNGDNQDRIPGDSICHDHFSFEFRWGDTRTEGASEAAAGSVSLIMPETISSFGSPEGLPVLTC